MASRDVHEFCGAIIGGAVATSNMDTTKLLANPVLGAVIGKFAGRLPDLIEPAHSPNHRQFFHSWVMFGLVGYGLKMAYDWQPQDDFYKSVRCVALVMAAGVLSHLILDSLTKRSLPII